MSETALLHDARRLYLYDPYYGEVYSLTRLENAVEITKPVWFGETVGPVRHAATVSAIWKDRALSQPVVQMQPAFEKSQKPTWEVGKMQRMIDMIREAVDLLEKEPVAATGPVGNSFTRCGDL